MANREGKALSFVRVPSNYAGGIQEGDPTPVYIDPDGGSGIPPIDPAVVGDLPIIMADGTLEGSGTQIVLEQDPNRPTAARNRLAAGAAPNTLGDGAVDLQGGRNFASQAATGSYSFASGLFVTASGSNSVALGVGTTASGSSSYAEGGSTTASGIVSHAEGSLTTASGDYSHAGGRRAKAIQAGTYARADSQNADFSTIIQDEYAIRARGGVRLVTATDGAGVPTKTTTLTPAGLWTYNDAASRNAQLTELFASIPTSPGAVGTLWNDGGTIKIVV